MKRLALSRTALTAVGAVIATAVIPLAAGPASAAPTGPVVVFTVDGATGGTTLASAPVIGDAVSATYDVIATSPDPLIGVAVSPDGSKVAYTRVTDAVNGAADIYIRNVDGSGIEVQVTSTAGLEFDPAWSPNGATILFTQYSGALDAKGDLWTVAATGGTPAMLPGGTDRSQGVYTPDGAAVIAVDDAYAASTGDPRLSRITLSTGVRSAISGSLYLQAPSVSPDGTRIAAERLDYTSDNHGSWIGVLPIAGGTIKKASARTDANDVYAEDYVPAWNTDGSRIYFSRYYETLTGDGIKLGSVKPDATGQVIAAANEGTYNDYPSFAVVDTLAPIATMTALSITSTTSGWVVVNWTGFDRGGHGVASYDVKQSRYSTSGVRTDTALLTATTLKTKTVAVARGYVYCFSVRAKDSLGNGAAGAYSAAKCVTVPLDDTSLTKSTGWFRTTSSSYYVGSALTAAKKSASLTKGGIKAKQIGLLVRTCSTCGAVAVYIGATKIGTVSTRSSSGGYRKLIWLPASASLRSGTLKLLTTSASKVFVDGVAIKSV